MNRNSLDKKYQNIVRDILENGVDKGDRTGTGTISTFGKHFEFDMSEGFPILTSKKMAWKQIVSELLWFLRGDTNIKWLLHQNNKIWAGDSYKNYSKKVTTGSIFTKNDFIEKIKTDREFSQKYGNLGSIYGKQWRNWETKQKEYEDGFNHEVNKTIDQIQGVLDTLKTNPDSRRMIVNSWNVGDLDNMVLPPCHYSFEFYTRELNSYERENYYAKINNYTEEQRLEMNPNVSDEEVHELMDEEGIPTRSISLRWIQRSVDTPLGLPFNIASYGLLLEIFGRLVNMIPEKLVGSFGDTHIYKNQIDGIRTQLTRGSYKLPTLEISNNIMFDGNIDDFLQSCITDDFQLRGYKSYPKIKFPLSN